MKECNGCRCQAPIVYSMPNGQELCDYCSEAWVKLNNKKKEHKPREYNNTKWMIKMKHGTIRSWAKKHGFSPGVVAQVLNKSGYYNVSDIEVMSLTHLDILATLEAEGLGSTLVADGYINNQEGERR